ncbi:MAG: hypothetical protein RMH93_05550 [Aquificaceae bacterium]|nr:hypothetical protein [Aquificaceae bacterium]
MEIRRIEGTLLQHAIERLQSLSAERTGEGLRIRALSSVPEVLMELSSGGEGSIKAKVTYSEGRTLNLLLSGGSEIKAENRSSLELMTGDVVELKIETTNPLTLRIVGLHRRGNLEELLKLVLEEGGDFLFSISPDRLKEDVENSGLFYERKLLDLLLGKLKPEELLKDAKAQLLSSVLRYGQELSRLLKAEGIRSLEDILNLLELLKAKNLTYSKLKDAIRGLFLENLPHEEYVRLVKDLQSQGERGLILALEKRDLLSILKELFRKEIEGRLERYPPLEQAFKNLRSLEEPVLRELLREVEGGSERNMKEAYQALRGHMERAERLLEFERTKGTSLEQLLRRLELINRLQWMYATQGYTFYLPVYYEGGRGGLLFKGGRDYIVVFKLGYEEGFIGGVLSMPRESRVLNIKLFTDQDQWSRGLRESREMLRVMLEEEGIRLKSLLVELIERERLLESMRASLSEEAFLLLA